MKEHEKILAHDVLTERLKYNERTGVFTWIKDVASNARIGDIAGYLDALGYRRIYLNSVGYMAHRLAWFYMHGHWPIEQLDHINNNKSDNRSVNLREATEVQNRYNRVLQKNNKLKIKGVSRHSQIPNKFVALIGVNGKQLYLGLFDSPEEAHAAYVKASPVHHGEFGRTF